MQRSHSLGGLLLRNAALWALAGLPAALLAFFVVQRGRGQVEPHEGVLDLTVIYPGLLAFTLPGVALYCVVLVAVAARGPVARHRLLAIALVPLVLVPLRLVPFRYVVMWPPMALGMLVGLGIFAFLAVLPAGIASASQADA